MDSISKPSGKMEDILEEGEGTINVMPTEAKEGPKLEDPEKQIQTKTIIEISKPLVETGIKTYSYDIVE